MNFPKNINQWKAGALRQAKHHAAPLMMLIAMVLFIYWPVLPATAIFNQLHFGDALINCYLINWFQYSLWVSPFNAFDAPIFYPQETAGAFSSINLFISFLTGPVQLAGNPVFAYNFAIYLAVFLSGMSMYCCTFLLFQNRKASLVAGVLFCCNSDMIWHFFGHPNIISPIFIPPLIYLALELYREPRWQQAVLFSVFLYCQFLCSFYLGFIILIGITPVMLIILAARTRNFPKQMGLLVGCGVLALIMIFLLTGPFREVSDRLGNGRSIHEMINNSAELTLGYLLPAFHENRNESFLGSLLGEKTPFNRAVNSQYFGLTVYATVTIHLLIMLGLSIAKRKLLIPGFTLFFLLIILMGFLFSFGPLFWWKNQMTQFKLPMWYVYEYIEPLRFLREVSRFAVLVVAGLSFLLALVVSQWSWINQKALPVRLGLLAFMLIVLSIEFRPVASAKLATPDMRAYALLAQHPEIKRIGSIPANSTQFLVQSTATFAETPSGYKGGVYNNHYEEIEPALNQFASGRATAIHAALGVEGIFVTGKENLALALEMPELEPLSRDPDAPFGLFKLNADLISPERVQAANTFLEGITEFPQFDVVAEKDLVKSPYSFPIDLGGPQKLFYNSTSLAANAGAVPIYSIQIPRINALMMKMSLTSFGSDYQFTKIYFTTERQPNYSEYKSITAIIPPDDELHWVKFDFAPFHEALANDWLTGIRFEFSSTPYPGQEALIDSIYLDLSE
ncbi:MAG: hypothetical protein ACFCU1_11835 [Sumerlaeia bacterium]